MDPEPVPDGRSIGCSLGDERPGKGNCIRDPEAAGKLPEPGPIGRDGSSIVRAPSGVRLRVELAVGPIWAVGDSIAVGRPAAEGPRDELDGRNIGRSSRPGTGSNGVDLG